MEGISIPIINLEKFEAEKEKLMVAVTRLGCFRVINHNISEKLIMDVKANLRSIFELPSEIKHRNTSVIMGSGYLKPTPLGPLYEGFGIYDASLPTDIDAFCSCLDISPQDREILCTFTSKLHDLVVDLAFKIADALEIVGCSFQDWSCHMRLNKYHFSKETVGSCGLHVHTDHSFITVLLEDDSNGGLEIMDSSGNFIFIDHVPRTFVVNIGDIGKVWSNGRLQNVKHRVLCKKGEPRITIAFFMLAPKDNKVEPQAGLIDFEHPQLYQSFDYMEYRKIRLSTLSIAGEVLVHWTIDEAMKMA